MIARDDARGARIRGDIGPSYGERLPKYLIEAAAGLPLVTADVPGCRTVVNRGANGLLGPPRDPGGLAAALEGLRGGPDQMRRCGAQSRLRAQAKLGNERIFARVLGVCRELLERP